MTVPALPVSPSRPLDELARTINAEHKLFGQQLQSSVAHARRAGELLLQVKQQVGHGHWLPWLKTNLTFSERTAQDYIRVARRWDELIGSNPQRVADLTYREAVKLLADRRAGEDEEDTPPTQPVPAPDTSLEVIGEALHERMISLEPGIDDRARLARALAIGQLLAAGRRHLGDAEWGTWFDRHVDFTRSLGGALIRLAECSTEGSLSPASLDEALKGLEEFCLYAEPMAQPRSTRPPLPEPLAILGRAGLLDDEALAILLSIHDDLGPEILHYFKATINEPQAIDADNAMWLLNGLRPLDQPSLWPLSIIALDADDELHVSRRGQVQRWEGVALWYAASAVLVHSLPSTKPFTAASILRRHVANWRESLYTALVVFLRHEMPEHPTAEGELSVAEWWGYHSDLRHAGIVDAAEAIAEGHGEEFQTLVAGWRRFGNDMIERGTHLLPTAHQGRRGSDEVDSTSELTRPEEDG
jgi:hypothetical protein